VEATNSTSKSIPLDIPVCDATKVSECTDQSIIQEKYDKQIGNLNITIANLNVKIANMNANMNANMTSSTNKISNLNGNITLLESIEIPSIILALLGTGLTINGIVKHRRNKISKTEEKIPMSRDVRLVFYGIIITAYMTMFYDIAKDLQKNPYDFHDISLIGIAGFVSLLVGVVTFFILAYKKIT